MLCDLCEKLARNVIHQDFSGWAHRAYRENEPGEEIQYRHSSYDAISKAAARGCRICAFLEPAFELEQDSAILHAGGTLSWLSHFLRPVETRRATFSFRFHFADAHHKPLAGSSLLEVEFFQVPDGRGAKSWTVMPSATGQPIPYQLSRRPDTPWCTALVLSWLTQCELTHENCRRRLSSPPPTRIIDVATATQDPRLVVTNGSSGRYVTLSYCWGAAGNAIITTKKTFSKHREAISMKSLPATLWDAVLYTRALGFRYLWIDALCIVQDDPEDWSREAAKMCQVFESAALSLSTLSARTCNTGFLLSRAAEPAIARADGVDFGVRSPHYWPHQALAHEVANVAPLETRAWCLQERVLAPAILHIGDQLYWECCSGLASETYPVVREKRDRDLDSTVHEMKLHLRNRLETCSVDLWYALVSAYTKRSLSRGTDRLAAIEGLATRFRSLIGAEYHSGLWSSDLYVGLLWSVGYGDVYDKTRHSNAGIPSWSWASIEAPIRFTHETDVLEHARSRVVITPINSDETIRTTSLHIVGLVQKGQCIAATEVQEYCEFVVDAPPGKQSNGIPNIQCTPDYVMSDEKHSYIRRFKPFARPRPPFYSLLVAEGAYGSMTRFYYLILEQAGTRDTSVRHQDVFRRVGIGWQELLTSGTPAGVHKNAVRREIVLA